jgi:hypothetical protein
MNKSLRVLLLIVTLLFSHSALSARISNPSLSILPSSPDELDFIVAELSGTFGMLGYEYDPNPSFTLTGNLIDIAFDATGPSAGFFMLNDFSVSADLGQLAPGDYLVNATFSANGTLEHTLTDSFVVTSIPLPAAGWLLLSGMGVLLTAPRLKRCAG